MSAARNQKLILALLVVTIALGFSLRTYWNMDAAQTDDGMYVLSGNDPYYHKHAVDVIVEEWKHPRHDPMLNYPMGAINPNPPLFEWSIAAGAKALEPMAEDLDQAVWWSTLFAPAIWGTLTIIPVFLVARMFAGPWAGLLAGFFIATSPEHMSRTNLGFADHDAMVIFLAVMGFYFMLRALEGLGDRPEHVKLGGITDAYRSWFTGSRRSSGSALLAGAFWGALSLTWKGFPYVFGVILAYAGLQFLINHWRNRDVATPFFVLITALVVATVLGLPYYAGFGLLHFWNPALFLVIVLAAIGVFFVATQEYPSVLVLPGLLVLGAVFAVIMFFAVPEIAQALLNRLVYFRQTTLYTTIAEAHPPDLASLAFSVGPIPFFLYVGGFGWLLYRLWNDKRATDLFLFTWCAVDFYLAASAVRFLSQSVPTMAILAALSTVWVLRLLNLPNLWERYRTRGFTGLGRQVGPSTFVAMGLVTVLALVVFYLGYPWVAFVLLVGIALFLLNAALGIKTGSNVLHVITVLTLAVLLVIPSAVLAIDAAVPSNLESQNAREARAQAVKDVGEAGRALDLPVETVREFQQLVNNSRDANHFRQLLTEQQRILGFDNDVIDAIHAAAADELRVVGRYQKVLGAFGQNFIPTGWRNALVDLSERDTELKPPERPGFLAWWDYGHWAIAVGKHPAVADNFQNGYRLAGTFITATNESHAVQLLAARQARIVDEDTYVRTLVDAGLPRANATRAYDDHTSLKYTFIEFSSDETENLAASQAWLAAVEAGTGKHIRYIGLDNRMLPIDNPGTRNIESPSIFYAPVVLAGREPSNYVEDVVVNMQTGQALSDADLRAIQRSAQQVDIGQRLDYKAPFFESMFYRGFMGLPINEPVQQQGQVFPMPFDLGAFQEYYQDPTMYRASGDSVSGAALSNEVAPGFALTHFRLIYANEAVRMLKYYHGAIVEGQVTLAGEPVQGVRVTVFDDAGQWVMRTNPEYFRGQGRTADELNVPHDSVVTDSEGRYRLVAPFGQGGPVTLKVTQEAARGVPPLMATAELTISEADAEAQRTFTEDISVEPAALSGVVFLDANANGQRDDGEEPLGGANVTVQDRTVTTGEDGSYSLDELAPGSYSAQVNLDGFRLRAGAGRVNLQGGNATEHDLAMQHQPIQVRGTVEDGAGELIEGVRVQFNRQAANVTGQPPSTFSQINGTISIALPPGTYHVNGTGRDVGANQTLTVTSIELIGGTGASVNDDGMLVLEPRAANVEVLVKVERS